MKKTLNGILELIILSKKAFFFTIYSLFIVFSTQIVLADQISVLTYNVAGLPDLISDSNPSRNHPIIGELINPYSIVLVQEDFRYHNKLIRKNKHPYRSSYQSGGFSGYGDGLNRLSYFPFKEHTRIKWKDCSGYLNRLNDCLANKGFTHAIHSINSSEIHIYNVHMDAGRSKKDKIARISNVKQLINYIKINSKNQPIIVAGDFNLQHQDYDDNELIKKFMRELGLNHACRINHCKDEVVDKILFRSNSNTLFNLKTRVILKNSFKDQKGQLSDHDPVLAVFEIDSI